jgi:predicted metal-binding membrane protein
MERNQKVVLISIICITAISWLFSKNQPDTMKAMMVYDPIGILLFSISWTVGMVAMMFPSITPMILVYNREIRGRARTVHCSAADDGFERMGKTRALSLSILYCSLNIIFVGSYLAIWTIMGITLLLAWSVPVNNFLAHFETRLTNGFWNYIDHFWHIST